MIRERHRFTVDDQIARRRIEFEWRGIADDEIGNLARLDRPDLVADAQASTDVAPLDEDPHGAGVIATYTTAGPRVAAIIDLESGKRAVAACDDEALAARATQEDLIGTRVAVEGRTFTI